LAPRNAPIRDRSGVLRGEAQVTKFHIASQEEENEMPVIDDINLVVRASREIFVQTGAEPTAEEIGRKLGMTPERVCALLSARKPIKLVL